MTELDQIIQKAYENNGQQAEVNKVYTTFLRSSLWMPIEKIQDDAPVHPDEPFRPLFLQHEQHHFMMAFDQLERLQSWAGEQIEQMGFVILTGRDLIRSVGQDVYVCLNYGSPYYKEFAPDEVARLKTIVAKIDEIAK